jgi:hypothetical protein
MQPPKPVPVPVVPNPLKVPYPMHCVQPKICAGKSCCPRDPVCID